MKIISKRVISAAITSVLLLGATAALAGSKYGWPVYIVKNADGSGYGYGSAAAARSSSDSLQEVRCAVTWASATCEMWDSAGKYLGCHTTDAALMTAARAFGADSGLRINVNANGTCQGIYVYNWSSFAPKTL